MPCLQAQWESFTADMDDNKKSNSLQPLFLQGPVVAHKALPARLVVEVAREVGHGLVPKLQEVAGGLVAPVHVVRGHGEDAGVGPDEDEGPPGAPEPLQTGIVIVGAQEDVAHGLLQGEPERVRGHLLHPEALLGQGLREGLEEEGKVRGVPAHPGSQEEAHAGGAPHELPGRGRGGEPQGAHQLQDTRPGLGAHPGAAVQRPADGADGNVC